MRTHRLGDVLQIIPLLFGLRKKHPSASLHVLVSKTFSSLLQGLSCVDRVITLPLEELHRKASSPGEVPWVKACVKNVSDTLEAEKYDLVINRQMTRFEMCLAGGLNVGAVLGPCYSPTESSAKWKNDLHVTLRGELPPGKVDFRLEHLNSLLNKRKEYRTNMVEAGLDLAGVPGAHRFELPVRSQHREKAQEIFVSEGIKGEGPVLGIQAGAAVSFRHFPLDIMTKALNLWYSRHGGRMVFFGTATEQEMVEGVIKKLRVPEAATNLAGRTDILELAACMEHLDLLLSPDTGTMHIAAAMKTPTVSVFYGAAYPWQTGPYGENHLMLYSEMPCSPCKKPDECPHDKICRKRIRSSSIVGLLELSHDLSKKSENRQKESLIKDWMDVWSSEFSKGGIRMLHTGWKPLERPMKLRDLTPGLHSIRQPSQNKLSVPIL